ncbi:digestive organ expansion factor homolog [Galendromus occidentalis]|uniref:U3 small nucleolar RNA-associated protein 25 homolog n=1 Tax=Galendromus occidentalis TaxID=34638 RepID=A0AAJ7SEP5_9ACAR|nr:digestive organ expansion factor homolog [Galendromus occidentalis]
MASDEEDSEGDGDSMDEVDDQDSAAGGSPREDEEAEQEDEPSVGTDDDSEDEQLGVVPSPRKDERKKESVRAKNGSEHVQETGVRDNTSDEEDDSADDQEEGDTNYISHLEWEPDDRDFPPEPYVLQSSPPQQWPHLGLIKIQEPPKIAAKTPSIHLKSTGKVVLKKLIADNLERVLKTQQSFEKDDTRSKSKLDPFEESILNILNSYRDFYYPEHTWERAESLRLCYTLHCMNHILRSRARSVKHSTKIKKSNSSLEFQDQGLTRVKALIILPFKNSAYRVIKLILEMVKETKSKVINEDRFDQEFRPPDEDIQGKKPDDYYKFFEGDTDDMFRIGLRFTKRRVQLYASFYSADLVIASPVGLRAIIGAEGDEKRDFDFLSSIEIVVLDQTDVFFMQNWEHVIHIFKHLHAKPKESHGVDFSRVRTWCVSDWGKYFRQNIVLSRFQNPQINALLKRYNFNYRGLVSACNPVEDPSIAQVVVHVPQIFRAFEPRSAADVSNRRFEFFTEEILPQLMKDNLVSHCMIYVRQYFDFVRLRNFMRDLAEQDAGFKFCQISEYTEDGRVAQARSMFFHGKRKFLLYSERFHFFHRYTIKGVRHVVFYELPTYPHFYSEILNMLSTTNQYKLASGMESTFTATSLYCKYDVLTLKPILGERRTATVVQKVDKKNHLFTRD